MKLNLQNPIKKHSVLKGDIIVMTKTADKDYLAHYLVVEDIPNGFNTLVNMSSNMLMSSVRTVTSSGLLDKIKAVFPQLELVEIIPADQFEVVRKTN